MKVDVKPGKYVVAVSGGVDSMVLLELLAKKEGIMIVVAHLDHGIREDSKNDRLLVEKEAKKLGAEFEYKEVQLGKQASEATARKARYDFLNDIKEKHHAAAIITAHHQDDLLETAILNMLRGTGRKGMTSLKSTDEIIRPLLHLSKQEILEYALKNNLSWNEDSTNTDTKYLRNYIRINIIPRLTKNEKKELLKRIEDLKSINDELDEMLNENIGESIDRKWFASLPHDVACEVLASWLRRNGISDFDRKLIEKLVVGIKVAEAGKKLDVRKKSHIAISKKSVELSSN